MVNTILTTPPQKKIALIVLIAGISPPVGAADWTVTPSLTVKETYTDNITLAPPGQESEDFVTEIDPAISVKGEGRRLKLNFNYRMQNLIYAEDSNRNNTHHQLSADANAELVKDFFFLDARSTVTQQLISNTGTIARDNISSTSNRTDVVTYQLSPYLRHRFGGYVNAQARYTYDKVEVDQGASDGETHGVDVSLSSGARFTRLGWSLGYRNQQSDRKAASDTDYESANGEIRYAVTHKFDVLAQAGYENNDFDNTLDTQDGSYSSAGFDWHPSRRLSLQMVYGDRNESATLTLRPTTRTDFTTTYRDRDVGLNSGGSWSAALNHRTRRSTWRASYVEDTTTSQQLLLAAVPGSYVCPPNAVGTGNGAVLFNRAACTFFPEWEQPVGNLNDWLFQQQYAYLPWLTDEIFVRKRFEASVGLNTGKSSLNAGLFSEQREFQLAGDDEQSYGGNASWHWKFAPRTSSTLNGSWQRTDIRTSTQEDELWDVGLSITRQIRRKLDGSIEYRHMERDSNTVGGDYRENRLSVLVKMTF